MAAPGALTEQDVVAVREAAAAGKPVTVWFTAAAVGVPAGRSAKVSAVGDPSDGDFIQVRPAGSRDTMFCSPNELTRTRPARSTGAPAVKPATTPRASAPAPRSDSPAPRPAAAPPRSDAAASRPAAASVRSTGPTSRPDAAVAEPGASATKPAEPGAAGGRSSAAARPAEAAARSAKAAATPTGAESRVPASDPAAAPVPTTRPARGKAARPSGMTVTLEATAEGEWTVEVRVGTKRVVPAAPVPAADVATAARSLPPAVAEAIESSLESARKRQRDRVEQLRTELDAAQRVLDQLDV